MHRDLLTLALLLWFGVLLGACSEPSGLWEEDVLFSESLTVVADTYERMNGISAAEYVDAVAIYRLDESDDRHPSIATLRGNVPAYESRDRQFIRSFLGAATVRQDGQEDACLNSRSGARYYVAAFDRTLMRVGAFRSDTCETPSGRFATVRPIGGAEIYVSAQLASLLDAVAPVLPAD
jgi:hypothetical protein